MLSPTLRTIIFAYEYFGKWFVILLDVLQFFSSAILLIHGWRFCYSEEKNLFLQSWMGRLGKLCLFGSYVGY